MSIMEEKKRGNRGILDIVENICLNRCFVCSSYVCTNDDPNVPEKSLRLLKRLKFLKYLLKGSSLYKEVSELAKSKENDKEEITFCEGCDKLCDIVMELGLELEMTQLKLINIIQSVSKLCKCDDVVKNNPLDLIEDGLVENTAFRTVSRQVRKYLRETEIRTEMLFPSRWQPNVVLNQYQNPGQASNASSSQDPVSQSPTRRNVVKQEIDYHDSHDALALDDDVVSAMDMDDNANHHGDWNSDVSGGDEDNSVVNDTNTQSLKDTELPLAHDPENSVYDDNDDNLSDGCTDVSPAKRRKTVGDVPKISKKPPCQSAEEESEMSKVLTQLQSDETYTEAFDGLKNPRSLRCVTCRFKTEIPMTMDHHLRSHETTEGNLKCPDSSCGRSFSNKQHFVFHLQQHCSRKRTCSECDLKLPVLQMETHLKTHFDKLFKCEFCDFSFPTFPEVIFHTRFHSRVAMKCQLCPDTTYGNPKLYASRDRLRKHLYEDHGLTEVLLKCSYAGCSETFFNPYKKSGHENSHKELPTCEECSRSFAKYSSLYSHIEKNHKSNKELMKQVELFRNQQKASAMKRRRHVKIQNEASRLLSKMELEETSQEMLTILKKIACEEYVCLTCKYKCQKFYRMAQHIKTHEDEKKNYFCPQPACPASLTNKQGFIYHLQDHCRRYGSCESCNISLPVLELAEHLKTHTDKIFQCEMCSHAFVKYEELLSHCYNYHNKFELPCELCTGTESSGQRYPTRALLYEHLFEKHNMREHLLKCKFPECDQTFFDYISYQKHEAKSHPSLRQQIIRRRRRIPGEPVKRVRKPQKTKPTKTKERKSEVVKSVEVEKLLMIMEAKDATIFQESFKDKIYKCLICNEYTTARHFVMEQHFREHEAVDDDNDDKPFECPEFNCRKKFRHEPAFIFHLQNHSSRKRQCLHCARLFPILDLKGHLMTHFDEIQSCSLCDFCCESSDELAEHVKYHSKVNLKCELCTDPEKVTLKYSSYQALRQHLYVCHNKTEGLLRCPHEGCDKTSFNARWMARHKLQKHSGPRTRAPVLCDLCPKEFKSTDTLNTHQVNDHGKDPFRCEICKEKEVTFTSTSGLRRHMDVFHNSSNQRWQCSICSAELATKSSLIAHEQAHSEVHNFECEICSFSSKTLHAMKRHMKLHGEKIHKCELCSKAFTIKRYLNEHMLTHTKEQPFVCDDCGDRFNQRYSLTAHKKKKHGYQSTWKTELKKANVDCVKQE